MITNINVFNSVQKPAIGMGCTINYYTDCRPAEIVDIQRDGKSIFIRPMRSKFNKEINDYEYNSMPEASTTEYTLRKNGRYYPKGSPMDSYPLSIGEARYYYDMSF